MRASGVLRSVPRSALAPREKLREKAYRSFTAHLLAANIRPGQFVSQRELVALTGLPLGAIRELVSAVGGQTSLEGETLTITPPLQLQSSFAFATRGDHRMAMTAATLAVLARATVTLDDAECVAKSFPGFWDELAAAGAQLHWSTAHAAEKSADRRS